ncbi:MAG: UDP-glucose 4-epimerase, partial [uncultured Friedmanniella sp.]
ACRRHRRNRPSRAVGRPLPRRGRPRGRQPRRRRPAGARAAGRVLPRGPDRRRQGLRRALPVPARGRLPPRGQPGPQRPGAGRRLHEQHPERVPPHAGGGRRGRPPVRLRLERDGDGPADRGHRPRPDPLRRVRAAPLPQRLRTEQVPERGHRGLPRRPLPGDGVGGLEDQQRDPAGQLRPLRRRVGGPEPQPGQLLELHRRPRRRHGVPGRPGGHDERARGVPHRGRRHPGAAWAPRADGRALRRLRPLRRRLRGPALGLRLRPDARAVRLDADPQLARL